MRVCLLTSVGLRHAYMAHRIAADFELVLAVREEKGLGAFYENHPDRDLIADHFHRLAATEETFFADSPWDDLADATLTVPRGGLNTEAIAARIRSAEPDAVAVFGCGIIKPPVIDLLPAGKTFNLHQGLSPYYRGSGTNFWPFAEGRLEYIGVTLHLIDPGIDTGGIVAHERPAIEPADTLHTLGCKTVIKSADLLGTALRKLEGGGVPAALPQWDDGKLYRRADLDGAAIRKVREREEQGYVAEFVRRRELGQIAPIQLIRLEC
jgi:methionyl-tRNA formyltransferase